MIKSIKNSMTFLVSGMILMGCAKTDTLPEESKEGQNTLGYVIDGQSFGTPFGDYTDAFTFEESTVSIKSDSRYKMVWNNVDYDVVSMSLSHDGAGAFSFTGAEFARINNANSTKSVFILNSEFTNAVDITFVDYDKKILSGNFELHFKPSFFVAIEDTTDMSTNTQRISLSEGRFDLKLTD